MAEAFADPDRIEGYHAHIYYDPATRGKAERLRQGIGDGLRRGSAIGMTSPSGRIRFRCIRSRSRSRSFRGWCHG